MKNDPAPPSTSSAFPRCFSTLGCPRFTWEETLDFAALHGFDGIELRCLGGSVITPENFTELLPPPGVFRRELDRRGLRLAMLGTSVKLLERSERELDTLARFAEFADATGCPFLRIFDGGRADEPLTADQLRKTQSFLDAWAMCRRSHRLTCELAVETHDAFASLAHMKTAGEQLSAFFVLWDTHHTWRKGESLAEYHHWVRHRAVHIHLKDSVDRPSRRKPFTYVAPGQGEFPWSELQAVLQSHPLRPVLSFEWEQHWNPELPPLEDVVKPFSEITAKW